MNKISQKIEVWQKDCPDGPSYNDINAFIRFRTNESFDSYNPTDGVYPRFEKRLVDWLENLADPVEQRKLFELVPKLYYFGEQEFKALYRASFREIILNWIVDLYKIDITHEGAKYKIRECIAKTWFCAVTESMNIGAFCHVNEIHGQTDRPTWRYLARFGDMDKVKRYINDRGIEHIVILEDFVGSGSQFLGKDEADQNSPTILECLLSLGDKHNSLILPLISCPEGVKNINDAIRVAQCSWIQCNASFLLTELCFIRRDSPGDEILLKMEQSEIDEMKDMRLLINKIGQNHNFKYGAFGYRGTGSLIVMYTNCSDNTLAIIYEKTPSWSPLFHRIDRVS